LRKLSIGGARRAELEEDKDYISFSHEFPQKYDKCKDYKKRIEWHKILPTAASHHRLCPPQKISIKCHNYGCRVIVVYMGMKALHICVWIVSGSACVHCA
jgi:hypothetical protein